MPQAAMSEMLAKRRDRAIAVILGIKERECDQFLPPAVSAKLRKAVLDQVNEFYEITMDLARSFDNGDIVFNEIWLSKIDAIHEAVVTNGKH